MTNWRELGYVPNSDDEDISDGELSTQEEVNVGDVGPENESGTEDGIVEDLPKGGVAVETQEVEGSEEVRTVGPVASGEAVASQHIEEVNISNLKL